MRKFVYIIFLVFVTVACGQQKENAYNAEEFIKLKEQNKDLVLLDVRTPPELSGNLGKIDGVINIPLQELNSRVGELEEYKDKEIVLICRSGRRSGIATDILLKKGFTAYNLEGGMIGYRLQEKKNE